MSDDEHGMARNTSDGYSPYRIAHQRALIELTRQYVADRTGCGEAGPGGASW